MKLTYIRYASLAAAATFLMTALPAYGQNSPPPWNSSVTYNEGDVVRIGINYYRALTTSVGKLPTSYYTSWELERLRTNATWTVGIGHTFPHIYDAWKYVKNAVIDQAATLTLSILTDKGALDEQFNVPFNLDQPFGSNIQIIGDNINNINLEFVEPVNGSGFNGVVVDSGHSLGLLSNVNITAINTNNAAGICVDNSASLTVQNVAVQQFYYGARATHCGRLYCNQPVTGGNSLIVKAFVEGIQAQDSSFVSCPHIVLAGNNAGGSDSGLWALQHSEIDASYATVSQVAAAYFANHDSTIVAPNSSCASVVNDGYYALDHSYIDAINAHSGGNFIAYQGGYIDATGSTASGPYVVDSLGSYIVH